MLDKEQKKALKQYEAEQQALKKVEKCYCDC